VTPKGHGGDHLSKLVALAHKPERQVVRQVVNAASVAERDHITANSLVVYECSPDVLDTVDRTSLWGLSTNVAYFFGGTSTLTECWNRIAWDIEHGGFHDYWDVHGI